MSESRDNKLGRTHLRRRLSRYVHNASLMVGTIILGLYAAVGLAVTLYYRGGLTYMSPDYRVLYGYTLPVSPTLTLSPFSIGQSMLGQTGGFGFSVAEGLLKGTPWDLVLFAGILVPSAVIGLLVGVAAGGLGGVVDEILMTVTDVIISIPAFLVALLVYVAILPTLPVVNVTGETYGSFPAHPLAPFVFAICMILICWAPYARLVRSRAKNIAAQPFVEAAAAGGASKTRMLLRHILPNSVSPVFSQVPITLSNIIVIMIILSYMGLLTSFGYTKIVVSFMPSNVFPEWTWMLVNGMLGWSVIDGTNAWWGYVFPFLWILVFGLAVLLFCDGLEEFLSPQSGSTTH